MLLFIWMDVKQFLKNFKSKHDKVNNNCHVYLYFWDKHHIRFSVHMLTLFWSRVPLHACLYIMVQVAHVNMFRPASRNCGLCASRKIVSAAISIVCVLTATAAALCNNSTQIPVSSMTMFCMHVFVYLLLYLQCVFYSTLFGLCILSVFEPLALQIAFNWI